MRRLSVRIAIRSLVGSTHVGGALVMVDLPGFVAAQLAGAACGAALIGWLLREPAGLETPVAEEAVP